MASDANTGGNESPSALIFSNMRAELASMRQSLQTIQADLEQMHANAAKVISTLQPNTLAGAILENKHLTDAQKNRIAEILTAPASKGAYIQ